MNIAFLLPAVSCGASLLLCAALIPLLKKLRAGQYILGYVEEHKEKTGTPTMGGLAFIAAAALTALVFGLYADRHTAVAVTFGAAYAAVGFLDDFLKLRRRRNLGLKAYQKIVFQAAVALLAGVYCYRARLTVLYIPFAGIEWDIGGWIVPLAAFAFVAATNCVNLTDGLDGLAASVCFCYFAVLAALIWKEGESAPLFQMALVLCGALAGYLPYNTSRASVFMGDTGSLGLGGFVAALSAFSGNLLYIAAVGVMFVCSGISVLCQVIYYKKTKKRLFRMAPLHHHLQKLGYSESKIACAYSLVTALAGLLCLAFV